MRAEESCTAIYNFIKSRMGIFKFRYDEINKICMNNKLIELSKFLDKYFLCINENLTESEFKKLVKTCRKDMTPNLGIQIMEVGLLLEYEIYDLEYVIKNNNTFINKDTDSSIFLSCILLLSIYQCSYENYVVFSSSRKKINIVDLYSDTVKYCMSDKYIGVNILESTNMNLQECKDTLAEIYSLSNNINTFILSYTKLSIMYHLDSSTFTEHFIKPSVENLSKLNNAMMNKEVTCVNVFDVITKDLWDILKTRKVILSESGIRLKNVKIDASRIVFTEVFIKEFIRDNDDFIIEVYATKQSDNIIIPLFINVTKGYVLKFSKECFPILDILFKVYKMNTSSKLIKVNLGNKRRFGNIKDNDKCLYAFVNTVDRTCNPNVATIRISDNVEYDVCNNIKRTYSKAGEDYSVIDYRDKIEEKRLIKHHIRRLPNNQKASEKAKSLSKKYCLELGDEYTIVDDFEKIVKINMRE